MRQEYTSRPQQQLKLFAFSAFGVRALLRGFGALELSSAFGQMASSRPLLAEGGEGFGREGAGGGGLALVSGRDPRSWAERAEEEEEEEEQGHAGPQAEAFSEEEEEEEASGQEASGLEVVY